MVVGDVMQRVGEKYGGLFISEEEMKKTEKRLRHRYGFRKEPTQREVAEEVRGHTGNHAGSCGRSFLQKITT